MAYYSQSGAPVLPHTRIKKHINSPEGRYVLVEEACYIHPHGRMLPYNHHTHLSMISLVPRRISGLSNEGLGGSSTLRRPDSFGSQVGDGDRPSLLESPSSVGSSASKKSHKSKRMNFQFRRSPSITSGDSKKQQGKEVKEIPVMLHIEAPTLPYKRLQPGQSPERTYLVCNVGKELRYYEYRRSTRTVDCTNPIECLSFQIEPTCHDFNRSFCEESLELVVGFPSGDILYRSSPSKIQKLYNREGVINSSRVMCVKWVPGSRDLFMHGHEDGTVYISSKDRSDPSGTSVSAAEKEGVRLPHYGFSVHHPKGKSNPISRWRVGKGAVNEFAFSPDGQLVAIVSRDGCLRIVNVREERLLVTFQSYFGALLCVCWSPDGQYLLTGGEDDLVSVWSFEKRQLVARGEGHGSWVSAVAFDPWMCDANSYRFGSVGLDQRLLLWDFSVNTLHKPRVARTTTQIHPPNDAATPIKPLPRLQASTLEPISSTLLHASPLTGLEFHDDALLTACQKAEIRVWARPSPDAERVSKPAKDKPSMSAILAQFAANLANPTSTQSGKNPAANQSDAAFSMNPAVSINQPTNQTQGLKAARTTSTSGPHLSNFSENRENVASLDNPDGVDYDYPLGDTTVVRTPSICPAPPDSEPPPPASKTHGVLARVKEGEVLPPGPMSFVHADSSCENEEKPVRETFGMRLVDPESEEIEGTPLTGSIVINAETKSDDEAVGERMSDDADSNRERVHGNLLSVQGEERGEEGLTDEEGWERVSRESRSEGGVNVHGKEEA